MSPDIQARRPGTRAGVLLRDDRFDLVTRILGCESEMARSRLLDVDPKTIYRARRGVIGEEFIAKTLAVLDQNKNQLAEFDILPTFEEIFVVGEKRAA